MHSTFDGSTAVQEGVGIGGQLHNYHQHDIHSQHYSNSEQYVQLYGKFVFQPTQVVLAITQLGY